MSLFLFSCFFYWFPSFEVIFKSVFCILSFYMSYVSWTGFSLLEGDIKINLHCLGTQVQRGKMVNVTWHTVHKTPKDSTPPYMQEWFKENWYFPSPCQTSQDKTRACLIFLLTPVPPSHRRTWHANARYLKPSHCVPFFIVIPSWSQPSSNCYKWNCYKWNI